MQAARRPTPLAEPDAHWVKPPWTILAWNIGGLRKDPLFDEVQPRARLFVGCYTDADDSVDLLHFSATLEAVFTSPDYHVSRDGCVEILYEYCPQYTHGLHAEIVDKALAELRRRFENGDPEVVRRFDPASELYVR